MSVSGQERYQIRTCSEHKSCKDVFTFQIIDLQRVTTGGFARGSFLIEPFSNGSVLKVDFQNENLAAYSSDGSVLASVPHLITVLETETGLAVQTEDLRFGMRVSAVVLPAPGRLLTAQALGTVGPRAFGLEFDEPVMPS